MQSIIELSRTQDEEVGDGTTSVIILGANPIITMAISKCQALHRCCPGGCVQQPRPAISTALLQTCDLLYVAAGEMLTAAEPHLDRHIHPTVICRAFMKALDDAVEIVEKLAFTIDFDDRDALMKVVDSCIATKFTRRFGTLIPVRDAPTTYPHHAVVASI